MGKWNCLAKLDIATSGIEDAKRASDEYRQDADEQRAKAEEGNIKIAKLQTEFKASQSRFDDMEQVNTTLKSDLNRWQEEANESRQKVAGLTIQLESANGRIADFERANADLQEQVGGLLEQTTATTTNNAELQAKLDAAEKRLEEQTDIEKMLKAQFEVMANEAISKNSDVFAKAADEKIGALLTQAKTDFSHSKDAVQELVKPLSDELKRIETARAESQGGLTQQISALVRQ